MSLYDNLVETYGYNKPIFTSDVEYQEYSTPWIYKELNMLCQLGRMIRYEKGVYYIPNKTIFGASVLNPREVIDKRYVKNGENIIGYYSGVLLLNQISGSTQMTNTLEVYTNRENSQVRNIMVGKQKVLLRKARTEINQSNVDVLRFLELMNSVSQSYFNDERKKTVLEFIQGNKITRKAITRYAPFFPDKAMRTLVESEIIYDVA